MDVGVHVLADVVLVGEQSSEGEPRRVPEGWLATFGRGHRTQRPTCPNRSRRALATPESLVGSSTGPNRPEEFPPHREIQDRLAA